MAAILFANLLLAHIISDFLIQTNKCVVEKRKYGVKGAALYFHSLTVAMLSYAFSADFRFWYCAIFIFVSHAVVDYVKTLFRRSLLTFVLDQIVHVLIIYFIARYYLAHCGDWTQFQWITSGFELYVPALACAILFCTSPANYLIRETLAEFKIDTRNSKKRSGQSANYRSKLKNAGALIGTMERLLILLFVLIGNYEAAGLTVAAKSILRFKDDEGPRTEFVLVGTLLSFLIAVCTAVVVLALVFDFKNLK